MATILFAAEYGYGFGHLARLLLVADALATDGHRCLFAVRDPVEAGPLFRGKPYECLQAPYVRSFPGLHRTGSATRVAGMADILYFVGFGDEALLAPQVAAWDGLLRLIRPDLVIADYSPVLGLALAGAGIPRALIGDGFSLPPDDLPVLPALRSGVPAQCEQAQLLDTVAAVQRARGRAPLDRLSQLFSAEFRAVCVVDALDPYRRHRREARLGPLRALPAIAAPSPGSTASSGASGRIFAYLAADQAPTEVAAEAARGRAGTVYLRNPQPAVAAAFAGAGWTVESGLLPFDRFAAAVAAADAVLHHGGVGTAQDVLALGRPQILLPLNMEQQLTAAALGALGVGGAPRGTFDARTLSDALDHVVRAPVYAVKAAAAARAVPASDRAGSLSEVATRCRALLENH